MKLALLSVLTLALAAFSAPSAFAAEKDDVAAASAHFKKGVTDYRQARYQEAIAEFQAAYKAKPAGVLHFNIAQAHEKLGDIASALREYHEYLHETPKADNRATVEVAMSNLEKRLAEKGIQQLLVFSEPTAAAVTIDGKLQGTSPISVEVRPGAHTVEVELAGHQPVHRQVNVAPDKSLELDIALQAGTAAPERRGEIVLAPEVKPTETPKPANETAATEGLQKPLPPVHEAKPRLWTWVAAGTAGAALVGALIVGTSAKSNSDTLRDGQVRSHGDAQQLHDSAKNQALISNVLYGVAGVAGAAGVTLFFVEGSF